ncbi:MAG: T9SS type A sorting domain-containing protein [Bacteroidales bacterium]|nr:T9SS type A sorting domain-containing protein [Bacteroidales bacterium]
MKKLLLLVVLCFVSLFNLSAQEIKKVLFIGNSYTHVNDLPTLVRNLSLSMGEEISCESITPGGARFMTHAQNSNVISKLQEGNWDFVVLQGQSQEVAFPDGQFFDEVYPYARELDSLAKVFNPDVKVLFYMTWGYRYGDQVNCQYYPPFCTYESMSLRLKTNYCLMANDFSSWVSPVGAAWSYSIANKPELVLHSSDNSHPSIQGSYLAACCFYIMMSGNNVVSDYLPSGVSAEDGEFLQNVANRVAFDSIDYWKNQTASLEEIALSNEDVFTISPNPAKDDVNIIFNNDLENVSIELVDVNAKIIDHKTISVTAGKKITLSSFGQKGNFIVIVNYSGKKLSKKIVII